MTHIQARNCIEKIWDAHVVTQEPGHPAVFAIDLMLIHEVTSAQAFSMMRERGLRPFDTSRLLATLDHSIPTRKNRLEIYDEQAANQVATLRENCRTEGIEIFDFNSGFQGIVHVIGPELGVTQPGMTIVCGDSHTSTHGAFGALAFGVGTSEVGHVLVSSCILQSKPKTMKVEFRGRLATGASAKDLILRLISEIGIGGANGHIIEYCGDTIATLSMEERMTICNMSIECGARAGLIAPDDTTYTFLRGRPRVPSGTEFERAVERWSTYRSDPGCHYDREIVLDATDLEPMITWGTNPSQGISLSGSIPLLETLEDPERSAAQAALDYVKLQEGQRMVGVPIQWAFIGSCTNGRIEDLRIAAEVLREQKVHPDVTLYIVPGSEQVMRQAQEEGLDKIFDAAGAHFRNPGCSMCLGMNDDKVPAGARCISSSNRNFVGRQGTGSYTHLASPATVATSAIYGCITAPGTFCGRCR
jgi:3-isopropylmalate/(R)-2-methylmalate dehydratase large subunit